MNVLEEVQAGATDVSVSLRALTTSTGAPAAAFDHATAGIDLWYRRDGAAKVSITEAALAALTDAHADGGVEFIGDGYFRLDLPDAACAAGARKVLIGGTATGITIVGGTILLNGYDRTAAAATEDTVAAKMLEYQGAHRTTIATLTNQTNFTLTAGSADNDAYNGWTIIVVDASTAVQKARGRVLDYVGSTKAIVLAADPAIFTMAVTDIVILLPESTYLVDAAASDVTLLAELLSTDDKIDVIKVTTDKVETMIADEGSPNGFVYTATALVNSPVGGGGGLDAAGMRAALGMSAANLDTQLGDLPTNAELNTALASADDAVLAAIAALNNLSQAQAQTAAAAALTAYDPPTRAEATADKDAILAILGTPAGADLAADIAAVSGLTAGEAGDAVLDEVVEGTITLRQSQRLMLSVLTGNATGLGTGTEAYRDVANSKTRVGGTVTGGTRTVNTRDGT